MAEYAPDGDQPPPSEALTGRELDAAVLLLCVSPHGAASFWIKDGIAPARAAAYLRRAADELDRLPPATE